MKKTLFLFILISLTFTSPGYANTAIGAQFGHPGDIALALKFNNFPVMAISWDLGGGANIGLTIDRWLINDNLSDAPLLWYLGAGIAGRIHTNNDKNAIGLGLRLPVGLQFFPVDPLELYLEGAPGLAVLPELDFDVAVAIGIRYHFR